MGMRAGVPESLSYVQYNTLQLYVLDPSPASAIMAQTWPFRQIATMQILSHARVELLRRSRWDPLHPQPGIYSPPTLLGLQVPTSMPPCWSGFSQPFLLETFSLGWSRRLVPLVSRPGQGTTSK